jgi:hypothetical protein
MSYYLSEAYSDLYNPRVDSNFDDNLRFIDSMLDEDIEEVVESLVWEICDYGNNLDESFNILSLAASDKIITEAYEELAGEYLTESRSQVMARRAMAKQGLEREKGRLQSDLRKDARRARVDGAISRVKSAIAGARGGMGRAAKNLGGAIAKARTDGKARLGQLLRRGVSKVQSGAGRLSRAYTAAKKELTGETARQSDLRRATKKNIRAARRAESSKDTSAFEKPFVPKGPKPPLPPRPETKKPVAALPSAGGTKGREMSPRRKEALAKIQKAAKGETKEGIRFSAPGGIAAPKRAHTDILGQRSKFARKALKEYEEILDSILDSLVEEKYAVDHDSALNIFLNLSEDMVYDLTGEFLVD